MRVVGPVLASVRVVFYDLSDVETITKIVVITLLGALLLGVSLVYSKFKVKNQS